MTRYREIFDEISCSLALIAIRDSSCCDELSLRRLPLDEHPVYSIGAVERMVGIPVATIRNWEERYGLITPERSQGGHRLYSRGQVEQLRFVKRELDAGPSAGGGPPPARRGDGAGEPLPRDERAQGRGC